MADARAPKVAADPDDRARQRTQEQDLGDVGGPGDDLRSPGAGPGTGAPGGDTGLGHDWGGHRPPGIDEADATPGIDDLLGTDGSSGPDSLGGGLGAPPTGADLLDAAITPGSGLSTGLDPGLDPDAKGWDAGFDGVASEGEGPFHLVANPAGLYGKQTLFIDSNDEVRPISDLAPGTMVTWDVQKGGLLGASQFDLDADEVYADATGKAHAVVGYDNKLHNIGDGLGEPPADTEAAPAEVPADPPPGDGATAGDPSDPDALSPEEWREWQQQLEGATHHWEQRMGAELGGAVDPGDFGSGSADLGGPRFTYDPNQPDHDPEAATGGPVGAAPVTIPHGGAIDPGDQAVGGGGVGADADPLADSHGPLGPGGHGLAAADDAGHDPFDDLELGDPWDPASEGADDDGGGRFGDGDGLSIELVDDLGDGDG